MSQIKVTKNQRIALTTEEKFRRDLIIVNNPVLVEGLALAPIIGAAVTMRNAVMLSLMIPFLLIPTRFFGNLLVGIIPQRLRAMFYSIMASLFYIPGYIVLQYLFDVRVANLGIYLPMLVVDSIIITRTEVPHRETVLFGLLGGVLSSIGFALAAVLVGGIREILGAGRLWGRTIFETVPLPIISTAAGGFMVVAILCAILQQCISTIKRIRYRYAKDSQYI